MSGFQAAVVIRVLNREAELRSTLTSLVGQSVRPQIIVVDSGSEDGSVAVAREAADEVIEIPADRFSYGRALNIGTEAADANIVFALSSHTAAPSPGWVERWLGILDADSRVAGVSSGWVGDEWDAVPGVGLMRMLSDDPYVGFSNTCSAFRRSVWADHRFDEDLPACEDKQWAAKVIEKGFALAFDRLLVVEGRHRRREGVIALARRARREGAATAVWTGRTPPTAIETLRTWWHVPGVGAAQRFRRRIDIFRTTELLGRARGEHVSGKRP